VATVELQQPVVQHRPGLVRDRFGGGARRLAGVRIPGDSYEGSSALLNRDHQELIVVIDREVCVRGGVHRARQ
jgi:hypothetical protein